MTLIDKEAALAPCPFCGGEAVWKSGGPGCAWISCKSCPAETSDGSIPRIMEAWNRRAALPARGVGVPTDAAKIIQKRIDTIIAEEGSQEWDTGEVNLPEWAQTAVEELEGILAAITEAQQ